MDLLKTPFYVLGATQRDNRRNIIALAEDCNLVRDPDECSWAKSQLITPRKRLSAEVAWLPGLNVTQTTEILDLLDASINGLLNITKIPPMARANSLAAGLSRVKGPRQADKLVKWILLLAQAFETIDPEALRSLINEERADADFPEVNNVAAVEAEIQERRRYYKQVITTVLGRLSHKDMVSTVTIAMKSAINGSAKQVPTLIDDLVDAYEIKVQSSLETETENIKAGIAEVHRAATTNQPDVVLERSVSQLIRIVKRWGDIALPIQISAKSRGLDHDPSRDTASIVRDLAIILFNTHDELEIPIRLTEVLQGVFAEVPEIAERVQDDAEYLRRQFLIRLVTKQRDRKEEQQAIQSRQEHTQRLVQLHKERRDEEYRKKKLTGPKILLVTLTLIGLAIWGLNVLNPVGTFNTYSSPTPESNPVPTQVSSTEKKKSPSGKLSSLSFLSTPKPDTEVVMTAYGYGWSEYSSPNASVLYPNDWNIRGDADRILTASSNAALDLWWYDFEDDISWMFDPANRRTDDVQDLIVDVEQDYSETINERFGDIEEIKRFRQPELGDMPTFGGHVYELDVTTNQDYQEYGDMLYIRYGDVLCAPTRICHFEYRKVDEPFTENDRAVLDAFAGSVEFKQ
jgi:hypothetical protein